MASSTRLLSISRLRYDFALYGHAMPFDPVKVCIMGGTLNNFAEPIFVFVRGRSVPISRGSPPIT